MQIEIVKGFRDILPLESLKRQKIKEIIEKNFKLFGFLPIETPTLEYDDFSKGKNEKDEAVSDRFKLKDKGNRDLALRYEFTFQLKRIFKEKPNIKLPFRRYQIGNVFRDEPISKDRYREFTQCDADIMGDEDINADAECIALGDKICKELEIKYKLKVNNRQLLNSILENSNIKDKESVSRELDKLDKVGEEETKKNLIKLISKDQIEDLFSLLKKDIDFYLKKNFSGAKEVSELIELCKIYKIKIELSPSLVRGLSYYTGTIFEAYNEEIKGSIFSGGRYDNLIGTYVNKKIPAVGISFGRILDYPNTEPKTTEVLLISIDQDKKTISIMNSLRENNISCFMMKKINKALDYASKSNIKFVIFLGKEEIKNKKIKLRNMDTGKENTYSEEDLILFLKKLKR